MAEDAVSSSGKKDASSIMVWNDLLSRPKPAAEQGLTFEGQQFAAVEIWKPQGDGLHPAVIMIHGGCWQASIAQADIMNWIADDLAKHGVGVWNIEYRAVDNGGGFPESYLDVGKAADLFLKDGPAEGFKTDKIVVIGHSAGGHLALWLANRPALAKDDPLRGDNPVPIDLAISQGGLPDLRTGETRDGHPCGTDAPKAMAGGEYGRTSPPEMSVGKARQILFNNQYDHVAPPEYAQAYIQNMAAKGVAVDYVETAGEGHVELIAPDSKSWAKQRSLILKEFGLK